MAQNDNKILVSFVGDSSYNEAVYTSTLFEGNVKSKYVQSTIVDKLLSFGEGDQVVIFRTNDSKVQNNYNRIAEFIRDKNIAISDEIIKEGNDEDEMWEMFEKIYSTILNYGKVYFDITYSFRSIPLFVSEILNFASTMRNTKVKAIYYAKENGRDKYEVIDLLPLVTLQQYTRLASDFKKYGRVRGVGEQFKESNTEAGQDEESAEGQNDDTNSIKNALINFDNYIQFNNLAKIKEGEYLEDIFAVSESDSNSDTNSDFESNTVIPLTIITEELRNTLRYYGFKVQPDSNGSYDSMKNIEAAILWCQAHDMLIQAFSLTREYVNYVFLDVFPTFDAKAKDSLVKTIHDLKQKSLSYFETTINEKNSEITECTNWFNSIPTSDTRKRTIINERISGLSKTINRITQRKAMKNICETFSASHTNFNLSFDSLYDNYDLLCKVRNAFDHCHELEDNETNDNWNQLKLQLDIVELQKEFPNFDETTTPYSHEYMKYYKFKENIFDKINTIFA